MVKDLQNISKDYIMPDETSSNNPKLPNLSAKLLPCLKLWDIIKFILETIVIQLFSMLLSCQGTAIGDLWAKESTTNVGCSCMPNNSSSPFLRVPYYLDITYNQASCQIWLSKNQFLCFLCIYSFADA